MTETHEFNGATVEEAVEKASVNLGVDPQHLSYEVIDEGSSGFLGIGARDARIVVNHGGSSNAYDAEKVEVRTDVEEPNGSYEATSDDEDVGELAAPNRTEVPQDLIRGIEGFITTAVEKMGIEARINVYDAGEFIAADVSSEEAGLFIGQKGETIDALQYLLNVAVYKDRPFVKKVIIDSEGYRQRRIEAIQGMAHRMARRAIRERRTIKLPPMNPSERRIVHLFLKKNPRVTTASEGAGDSRRVTVTPSP